MENTNQYIFSPRAVAFLDVLGFQSKLKDFELEAIEKRQSLFNDDEIEENDLSSSQNYFSQKASDFIDVFNSAISKLDKDKFHYYLFSDNICITAKNISSDGEMSLVELLLVISELYFEFAQKGYFLRGGIDYGLFIDRSTVALGMPLANAYKMESTKAVFPRIILSDDFIKQFEEYSIEGKPEINSIFIRSLIKQSCEIKYLNIFNHIFKVEDKEYFFESYNRMLLENLNGNKNNEAVFFKYRWLAEEFNTFINDYTNSLAYYDENFEADEDFLFIVKQLKINYGQ